MSENSTTTTSTAEGNTEPAAGAAVEGNTAQTDSQPAGGSRTFTQEQVNSLLAKERRDTEAKFAGFDELKAKAAKLDEMEEASKTELQKAIDALEKATKERDAAIADRDAKQAEIERAAEVAKAAREHGVDAELLALMTGDVAENAKLLASKEAARKKYPNVSDGGESNPQGMTLEEINAIKSPIERLRARAEYIQNHDNS